jgi:UDP-glucuronate 4-epimerase
MFQSDQVQVWNGDLCDPTALSGFVDDADIVYHFGGEIRDPRRFWSVNAQGTANLLSACEDAGVGRFLYLSSVGVMGAAGAVGRFDETTVAQPRNAYEASKHAGELAALQFHGRHGMQVSIVRPSIVFGEGQNPKKDRFLSWVRMVHSRHYVLLGGDYISSYTYVGDVVAACLTVTHHSQTGGQVYIVNEPVPLTTFVNEMATQLGVEEPLILPGPIGALAAKLLRWSGRFGSLYNRAVFSMEKLSKLGFKLPYGYKQGLGRTITWYREERLLPGIQ